MLDMLDGREIPLSAEHPWKVSFGNDWTDDGSIADSSDVHSLKAYWLIEDTLDGTAISTRELQELNAYASICVSDAGRLTLRMLLHPAKALGPIVSTLFVIATDSRLPEL